VQQGLLRFVEDVFQLDWNGLEINGESPETLIGQRPQ
jgi:hypothetical protein